MRAWIAAGSAALLVVAIAIVWRVTHENRLAPTASRSSGPAVRIEPARIGTVARTLAATGRLGPPSGTDAKLAFASPGILANVAVEAGQRVVAGQTLATLDRGSLSAALEQARADADAADATYAGGATSEAAATSAKAKLDAANARLQTLRAGGPGALSDRIAAVSAARQADLKVRSDRQALARAMALFDGGVIAAKDVDLARATLASDIADQRAADAKVVAAGSEYDEAVRAAAADAAAAQSDLVAARAGIGAAAAQRASARAHLASAETDFQRGILVAPADGVVASVLKRPGEAVDPTTPVIELVSSLQGRITLTVPGTDASLIRAGNDATLVLPGGAHASATVVAVVPAVDPTTQSTSVILHGDVPNAVSGQAVSATVVVANVRGVLVPATAIVTDPQTGGTVVFVRDRASKDTPYVSRAVSIRATDGTSAIVTGVASGEEIAATGGYDLLAPSGS